MTVFQVGSISGMVASWAVMKLVQEGLLDLDTPVETYLTRWHFPPSSFDQRGVTLRRLLSHTAGLSRHRDNGVPPDQPDPSLEMLLTRDVRLIREPGTGFEFSGGGYTLMELVIEEVTGEDFADYVQREILDPVGMPLCTYIGSPEIRALTAVGYNGKGRPWTGVRSGGRACCGLYATAEGLARFAAAYSQGAEDEEPGRGVLMPGRVDTLITPLAPLTGFQRVMADSAGLGVFLENLTGGVRLIFHSGGNRGWRAYSGVVPDERRGIVVLTNGDMGGAHVWIQVISRWSLWASGSQIRIGRIMHHLFLGSLIASVLFILGGILLIRNLIMQSTSGTRRWIWRGRSFIAPVKVVQLSFSLAFGVAWWEKARIIGERVIPLTWPWLNAGVTLWVLLGIVTSVWVRDRDSEIDKRAV
jgi:CubicO group peptidase (beta-lactamase class C family)